MISEKTLKSLEFDKILSNLSKYAVLEQTKNTLKSFSPVSDVKKASEMLLKTKEAYSLFYNHGVSGVFYFADVSDELMRADAGGTLNNLELLRVADNLKSARLIKSAFDSVNDDNIVFLKEIAEKLYVNYEFEKEITDKIISEDEISDNASPKLYSIRKSIRDINARIREKLNSYMRTGFNVYLQEQVVTMRQDRYVIPVKSEYRSKVKGFIHDQSSSGSTVFIEPEQVMELNNDLKKATFDEREEIYRILKDLSVRLTFMSGAINENAGLLSEIDGYFARAEYAFDTKSVMPDINDNGIIRLSKARHPLIQKDKVVPINVSLGGDYRFLLVTGPNTGGKTVTLKLVGLFSLMAMSGMFLPCEDESKISVFEGVYCDIGDEQSIEQDLSTFSSHIGNIINILTLLNGKSLILLDELGAGTDPEEGSALALAVINELLSKDCYGIITTHYSKLKEYAMEKDNIENASMEFDALTLKPLYRINVGIPGSSNAIEIAKSLGLPKNIVNNAIGYLSEKQVGFEKILKKAEETRRQYEILSDELEKLKKEKENELSVIAEEKEKIIKEREKIYFNSRQETKRIVADKLSEAEEIIAELKSILKAAKLESKEVFRASELKNRLENSRYLSYDSENAPLELKNVPEKEISVGKTVYVKSLDATAKVLSYKPQRKEIEVLIGDIRTNVKASDVFYCEKDALKPADENKAVKVFNKARNFAPVSELNVVGKTSLEALTELEIFIDQAVLNGLEEIRVVHGVGAGVLLKEIREYLKKDKNVKSFRRGMYGEGENGVTIVTLK